jgi:hypothetical protein
LIAVLVLPRFAHVNLFQWPLQIAENIVIELVTLLGR